eukprot:135670_1
MDNNNNNNNNNNNMNNLPDFDDMSNNIPPRPWNEAQLRVYTTRQLRGLCRYANIDYHNINEFRFQNGNLSTRKAPYINYLLNHVPIIVNPIIPINPNPINNDVRPVVHNNNNNINPINNNLNGIGNINPNP